MKVLMINGSPHSNGNTFTALQEMEKIFKEEGIATEIIHAGNQDIRGCIACYSCKDKGRCIFDDIVNEVAPKFEACDGLVVASPVSYTHLDVYKRQTVYRAYFNVCFILWPDPAP